MPESNQKPSQHEGAAPSALPRIVHIGLPIASLLVLLAFALTISLPANHAALPVQSTLLFVPIYLAIVIILVFASMYLFKAVMDKDVPSAEH